MPQETKPPAASSHTEYLDFVDRQTDPENNKQVERRVDRILDALEGDATSFEPASILAGLSINTPTHASPRGLNPVERVLEILEPMASDSFLGKLGHYVITRILGRGGFGVVLKAIDEKLQRQVAIKVLSPVLASDPVHRDRFLAEARSAAAVRHINVVQIYAVEDHPVPYIVMELVEGKTLHRYLADRGPLPADECTVLATQIAEGLNAAHTRRIVHRDIKPANILVEKGEPPKIKLTDFGLAHAIDDDNIVLQKVLLGTPAYMAPEQVRAEATDHRSDLFSFGSVLYVMCCGRPAFSESSTIGLLRSVAEDTPVPLLNRNASLPVRLVQIIERLHQKDPDLRYQSASELIRDLQKTGPQSKFGNGVRTAAKLSALVAVAAALGWPLIRDSSTTPENVAGNEPPQERAERNLPFSVTDRSAEHAAANQLLAEQLLYDVLAEMAQVNPAFDPRLTDHKISDGKVTYFRTKYAPDFTPLAAFKDLERLEIYTDVGVGTPTDLSFASGMKNLRILNADGIPFAGLEPLRGLQLKEISMWCWNWHAKCCDGDLSPLAGMPLERINTGGSVIKSLEPLRGLPLEEICLNGSSITDLSPLEGMQTLKILTVANTEVSDIRPLARLSLKELELQNSKVTDISPLANTPLRILSIKNLRITDYSPLMSMPLDSLLIDFDAGRDQDLLQSLSHIDQLNNRPIAEYLPTEADVSSEAESEQSLN